MTRVEIEPYVCMLHEHGTPKVVLVQLSARHEDRTLPAQLAIMDSQTPVGYVLVAIALDGWARCLMPWSDEAVSRLSEVGRHATDTLQYIEQRLLPWLRSRYGQLPVCLGGYSLGALFAWWAATQSPAFSAVAAASPSVWIHDWPAYVREHPICAQWLYTSMGDREELVRNQRMAAVGRCMRQAYALVAAQLPSGHAVLEWTQGGHFGHESERMAQAMLWSIHQLVAEGDVGR